MYSNKINEKYILIKLMRKYVLIKKDWIMKQLIATNHRFEGSTLFFS